MKNISTYLTFLKQKGRPLTEISSGSDEIALTPDDALQALELLKNSETIVLGADILSEDETGKLVYAIHLWGYDYHYLSWSCDRNNGESVNDYFERSYALAKEGVFNADRKAKDLKKKCYIVFVI